MRPTPTPPAHSVRKPLRWALLIVTSMWLVTFAPTGSATACSQVPELSMDHITEFALPGAAASWSGTPNGAAVVLGVYESEYLKKRQSREQSAAAYGAVPTRFWGRPPAKFRINITGGDAVSQTSTTNSCGPEPTPFVGQRCYRAVWDNQADTLIADQRITLDQAAMLTELFGEPIAAPPVPLPDTHPYMVDTTTTSATGGSAASAQVNTEASPKTGSTYWSFWATAIIGVVLVILGITGLILTKRPTRRR